MKKFNEWLKERDSKITEAWWSFGKKEEPELSSPWQSQPYATPNALDRRQPADRKEQELKAYSKEEKQKEIERKKTKEKSDLFNRRREEEIRSRSKYPHQRQDWPYGG